MATRTHSIAWADDLTRPAPLVAATVLAVNDHVLKGSGLLPGAVTGKLSDVAGLFVAPIAAVCVARGVAAMTGRSLRRDGRVAMACVLAVALVFALLKSWPAFHGVIDGLWGTHVLDPSDLWCLPMTALAWLWLRDREERNERAGNRVISGIAGIAVLAICAATSPAPPVPPPSVPMWSITATKPLQLPCGEAAVWVAKSGKTGLGVTVRVTPLQDQPCVSGVAASLKFADRTFTGEVLESRSGVELPANYRDPSGRTDLRLVDSTYHYIAFELDNEARWNRGDRTAAFEITIEAGGQKQSWTLAATHAYAQFPKEQR